MKAECLLALYEQVAEAPDAVPRLRRFVLDLAVRGKLVPQDAGDEPASDLLKRIAAEKARLKVKHRVSPMGAGEVPFPLPMGWAWTRIVELCSKTGSGSTPRGGKAVYKATGIPFLRSQNVYDDGLRLSDVAFIAPEVHERMAGTKVLAADLLLNITGGSIGRCCRVPDDFEEANISQHVAIVRPAVEGVSDFLHKLILSPYFQAFIFNAQTGAGRGGLPKNRMDRIAVPLPPLAEQRRIVGSVEELMSLLDRLEAARTAREATRDRLTAASLARLTAFDTEPDTEASSGVRLRTGTGFPSDDATNKDAPGALPEVRSTGSASSPATNQAVSGHVETGFPSDTAQMADSFPANARFGLATLPALTTRPDQIKPLSQTILNLAVRGKLVDQDPTDEPASELLKRIVKRRKELAAKEGVRKKKPVEPLAEEDELSLPTNWAADAFANLMDPRATISYGVLVPGPDVDDGIPFVRAQDLMLADHPAKPSKAIAPEVEAKYARTRLSGGEILLCVVSSIGKLGIAPQHWAGANIARAVARIAPLDLLDRDYLLLFLRSVRAQGYFEEATRTLAQPTLNVGLIEKLPIPLPPLAEQHRIVAKVDALMALCDRLEAALTTADTTRARLLEALLHEALAHKAEAVTEAAE